MMTCRDGKVFFARSRVRLVILLQVFLAWLGLALLGCPANAAGEEKSEAAASARRQAAERGLALIQPAAARYPDHRKCFSCHHQTLPMLAMRAARQSGLTVDQQVFESQANFTHASFAGRLDSLKEGTGIGGRSMTVAYGLWTLELASVPADEVTAAMVGYLLKNQQEDGYWKPQTLRPPLEESNLMCTVLAAYGMQKYAVPPQQPEIDAAVAKAKDWISKTAPVSGEDHAARLWGLHLLEGSAEQQQTARQAVLARQRDDGSWSQLDNMPGDAYATGLTLTILNETGYGVEEPPYLRGCRFLIERQLPDGSWLVETRSKPVQVFFDNGDPHGKHQFISTAASSWAVTALAASCKISHE